METRNTRSEHPSGYGMDKDGDATHSPTAKPEPSVQAAPAPISRPRAASDKAVCAGDWLAAMASALSEADAPGWDSPPSIDPSGHWVSVTNSRANAPDQGWKLHVSASLPDCDKVLQAALPVLLSCNASFKVAASSTELYELNSANYGLGQVGKFITVYPNDDTQAVSLAVALHEATVGFRGPAIPSDRPLLPGSLVHYRYGSFRQAPDRFAQDEFGNEYAILVSPAGDSVADLRIPRYVSPDWVSDPFLAAGVASPLPEQRLLTKGRYLAVSNLSESYRSSVWAGVDVLSARRCVLKRARRHAAMTWDGVDARDRLRHEADVLARISPDSRFPEPLDLFEDGDDLVLVTRELEGETLYSHIYDLKGNGRCLGRSELVDWGRQIISMLARLHSLGIVYRDLKPANIIVARGGQLGLVDFEIASPPGEASTYDGHVTTGYARPGQEACEPPSFSDDIYSLGALLYFMATGADPSYSPRPTSLLDRPVRLLNPSSDPRLETLIELCLDSDRPERFITIAEVADALDALVVSDPSPVTSPPLSAVKRHWRHEAGHGLSYGHMAHATGNAIWDPASQTSATARRGATRGGAARLNLATGAGGRVFAMSVLVRELDDPAHRSRLTETGAWLARQCAGYAGPAGLYSGGAGLALAVLQAGRALKNDNLQQSARQLLYELRGRPCASPDMWTGAAGRLLAYLRFWDATRDEEALQAAVELGEWLVKRAQPANEGSLCWSLGGTTGFQTEDEAYVGYAFGTAGIADALLYLFEATLDARYLAVARRAGRWIARQARPALEDADGAVWPLQAGGESAGASWAYGAAGIGRFLLHAAQLDALPGAERMADRAARTAARGARWAGPSLVQGLCGSISFLLDMYQALDNSKYLEEVLSLGEILLAFAEESGKSLIWRSDTGAPPVPTYMTGYAGVAVTLLRLSRPDSLPDPLARAAFESCSKRDRGIVARNRSGTFSCRIRRGKVEV